MTEVVWVVSLEDGDIDSVWSTEEAAQTRSDELDAEGGESTIAKFKVDSRQGLQ